MIPKGCIAVSQMPDQKAFLNSARILGQNGWFMDSLSQFVLGAAVSALVIGPKVGARKAALIGGVLGTLPDLDVLIPFADPVDSFVYHRGWTHSLFVHALAAPLLGEGLVRLFKGLREARLLAMLTVFLCLSTHALLDAMTIYGTRLFWPVFPDPVGVGSVFIADPLYTLPLLAVTVWALVRSGWSRALGRGVAVALVLSTAYLGWGVVIQSQMEARAREVFAARGIVPEQVLAIAGPFNTVMWKVIALEDEAYHNVYLSLVDGPDPVPVYTHPRRPDLAACVAGSDAYAKLAWFSRGFLKAEERDGRLVVSDLRMGMTPDYVFQFALADLRDGAASGIPAERDLSHRRMGEGDGGWLWARITGRPADRLAELTGAPLQPAGPLICQAAPAAGTPG